MYLKVERGGAVNSEVLELVEVDLASLVKYPCKDGGTVGLVVVVVDICVCTDVIWCSDHKEEDEDLACQILVDSFQYPRNNSNKKCSLEWSQCIFCSAGCPLETTPIESLSPSPSVLHIQPN